MTILFDAAAPVKPARPFAAGLIPSARPRAFEPSAEDRAWWAAECERIEAARLNAHYDAMAEESAAQARIDRGIVYC